MGGARIPTPPRLKSWAFRTSMSPLPIKWISTGSSSWGKTRVCFLLSGLVDISVSLRAKKQLVKSEIKPKLMVLTLVGV